MKKNILAAALAITSICTSTVGTENETIIKEKQFNIPEEKPVVLIINGNEIDISSIKEDDEVVTVNLSLSQEAEPEYSSNEEVKDKNIQNEPVEKFDILPEVNSNAIPEVSQAEIEMLACVIYCEAGGDTICDETRYYVADVVLNRIESDLFPNSMWEVLMQKGAYGRYYWTGIVWPEYSYSVWEQPAIERAYRIANDILVNGNHSWLYGEGYIWQSEYQQSEDSFYQDGFWFGR